MGRGGGKLGQGQRLSEIQHTPEEIQEAEHIIQKNKDPKQKQKNSTGNSQRRLNNGNTWYT